MWNDNYQSGMSRLMNVPPLIPPMCLLNPLNPPPLIGPLEPEATLPGPDNNTTEDMVISEEPRESGDDQTRNRDRGSRSHYSSRDNRDNSRKDWHSRDRPNRGRSRDRHADGKNERDRSERERGDNRSDRGENRSRRERRPSKWSTDKVPGLLGHAPDAPLIGNPMAPGMVQPFNSNNMMGNTMMGSTMEMNSVQNISNTHNMPNLANMNMSHINMQNMTNMPGLSGMQVMSGMNNMPNMMGNMMDGTMINQNMVPIANQPIYTSAAVLLPPVPGASLPDRRDRPVGCRTIFIGGLPTGVREDVINEIFSRFGTIVDTKLHRQGICHLRFQKQDSVEMSFYISGFRFKLHEQSEHEATTIFVDYALNRDDQNEFERQQRLRQPTPPRIEHFSPNTLAALVEKIKSDDNFAEAAPTLAAWLERGECNKRNANSFYSLIQASNNQVRRLFNEKMTLDEDFQNLKASFRDKFARVVNQFEQVAQILTAAKHQRVSDHFTKQQRRNIDMWLKMTEELENIKEEFNTLFDEEEMEKIGKNVVPTEKYEKLKAEHDTLVYELEGYKNEAFLAKDEAERKFEKFKAHFIAQQALQNKQSGVYPSLPLTAETRQQTPPAPAPLPPGEAKLISLITAFLMVHPLGAPPDYLVSYVRSLVPNFSQLEVLNCLQKHKDVFACRTSGVGARAEHRWQFVTFDIIKKEN